jgi:hypothetical protein
MVNLETQVILKVAELLTQVEKTDTPISSCLPFYKPPGCFLFIPSSSLQYLLMPRWLLHFTLLTTQAIGLLTFRKRSF